MIEILVALTVFYVVKSIIPSRMWWARWLNTIGHRGAAYRVRVTELKPGDEIHITGVTVRQVVPQGDDVVVFTGESHDPVWYHRGATVFVHKRRPAWYSGVCHHLADVIWALDRRARL